MAGNKVYHAAVSLPLQKAREIIAGALGHGGNEGAQPLTVVVIDSGGHTVAMERQDGSGIFRGDIALGKAWGALGFGVSSRVLGERLQGREPFQAALSAASGGRFIAVPGGVLVVDSDRRIIGAVGISGDASPVDEACALAGIEAAGLTAVPDDPSSAG